jgi:hypothetical protein
MLRTCPLYLFSASLVITIGTFPGQNNNLRDQMLKVVMYVAANNYYADFGPATANSFRKMMALKEAVYEEVKQKRL